MGGRYNNDVDSGVEKDNDAEKADVEDVHVDADG